MKLFLSGTLLVLWPRQNKQTWWKYVMALKISPWKWHVTSARESLIITSHIVENAVNVVGKYNFPQG